MMRQLRLVPIALAVVALMTMPALAHHGWSSYDSSKELTLDGVIKESGYEHPHGHIGLEVPGQDVDGHARPALADAEPRAALEHARAGNEGARGRLSEPQRARTRCAPSASPSTARRSSCVDPRSDGRRVARMARDERRRRGHAQVALALPDRRDRPHRRLRRAGGCRDHVRSAAARGVAGTARLRDGAASPALGARGDSCSSFPPDFSCSWRTRRSLRAIRRSF